MTTDRIAGRVCGVDHEPVDTAHPVEWLRGKAELGIACDPVDLEGVAIGRDVVVMFRSEPAANRPTPENLRRAVCLLLGEVHANNVREKTDEIIAAVQGATADRAVQLEAVLDEINQLRSNVTATQSASWSNMLYPLVAILNRAGYVDGSDDVTVERAAAHLTCYGGAGNSPNHLADDLARQGGYQRRLRQLSEDGWVPARKRFRDAVERSGDDPEEDQ